MDNGFDGIRKKVKEWSEFFARNDKPKPPERVKITEPGQPIRFQITSNRGEKPFEWHVDTDLFDELIYGLTMSYRGVALYKPQASGKHEGRTRTRNYKHVRKIEQWIDDKWVEIYNKNAPISRPGGDSH